RAGGLDIASRRFLLRLRGRECGFGLTNLIGGLLLLEADGRLTFSDLRAYPLRAVVVVLHVGTQLVGVNDAEQLPALDEVAFFHEQLAELPADLRRDDDVISRDESRKDDGRHSTVRQVVGKAADEQHDDESRKEFAHGRPAGRVKQMYKTFV